MNKSVAVIGGGPAGLMAAEVMRERGVRVDVYDSMPSLGRKFVMAGKRGSLQFIEFEKEFRIAFFTEGVAFGKIE